jgi:hypothetical protein
VGACVVRREKLRSSAPHPPRLDSGGRLEHPVFPGSR